MSWLSGWAKRRKIDIDGTNIDSNLTWFPVMVKIGTSVGMNSEDVSSIFDEVGSESKKIAVTDDSGDTQLYVEVERWDEVNEEAVLWVSKDGWEIASGGETIYIYYDSSQDDNTTYVADPGSRTEVWDDNYVGVWHLGESSDPAIDSTLNDNDGNFAGDLPTPVDGKVGKAQDFDGDGDYVGLPDSIAGFSSPSKYTFNWWAYHDDLDINHHSYTLANNYKIITRFLSNTGYMTPIHYDGGDTIRKIESVSPTVTTWEMWTVTWDDSNDTLQLFKDGAYQDQNTNVDGMSSMSADNSIGINYNQSDGEMAGKIDEFRISKSARTDAWIKTNYYAQDDNILDWYDEEEAAPEAKGRSFAQIF